MLLVTPSSSMKVYCAWPLASMAHFPGKSLPLHSPAQLSCLLLHMLSQSGQGWRIFKPPDRAFKVWDSKIFRFWQRWCQLSGSRDLSSQVVYEASLAPAAQEIKYTWTLKGRSSTSLKASSRQQRKSGKAKTNNKQLNSERNWGKRDVCWVQHSMSITSKPMGWPCENGNSAARTGNFHVSLQS